MYHANKDSCIKQTIYAKVIGDNTKQKCTETPVPPSGLQVDNPLIDSQSHHFTLYFTWAIHFPKF